MILTALSLLKTEVSLIFLFWIEVFIKAFLNNIFFLDLLWKAFWFVIFVLSVTCEEHEIEGNISLRLINKIFVLICNYFYLNIKSYYF